MTDALTDADHGMAVTELLRDARVPDDFILRNEQALNRLVKDTEYASPLQMVRTINLTLANASASEIVKQQCRLAAGRMLLECRTKVEADGDNFWKWQKGKFNRGRKDIEKLMRLARADNPEAAAKDAAERNKSHQAAHRAKVAKAGAYVSASPVDHILHLIRALTDEQRTELFTKQRMEWNAMGLGIDPKKMSLTAQKKLDIATRTMRKQMEAEYAARWQREIHQHIEKLKLEALPRWKEDAREAVINRDHYARLINNHKFPMTKDEWRLLNKVVHPDSNPSPEVINEASRLLIEKKLSLCGEK